MTKRTLALVWFPVQLLAGLLLLFIILAISDMICLTNIQLAVFNITDSMPRGLYVRSPFEKIHIGSIVTIPMPETMREYVRAYPTWSAFFDNHRLIKTVVAINGDTICRDDMKNFSVNGNVLGKAYDRGPDGRFLPSWIGCKRLLQDEIAVFSDGLPDSLDSRYWGATPAKTARVYRRL